ncbi:hypothetical protein DICPUDRAFT_90205 [Dictyostelium purpureum]|uniref:Uncharacterized protein n=1 Tax=Dictyostelium purpureum TaxID=5786 RepID=F1A0Z3_DICPU|nr:uncharacterized protein DICPUDRAFT_90205 [Dictyostelium purpureum]EGC30128.1 hypothetical protein DICPUDRAFT_90205 [Dictyostelium purpureum]|eukprot:XP_003293336.1 hypothetical protein DICPUDRAFT_90205 [Dictyostelium purpureum]
MFLSKRVCSNIVSKNLNKLKKKKANKIALSDTKKLLAKYSMKNPDDPNDNPAYYEEDNEDFDSEDYSEDADIVPNKDFIQDEDFDRELEEKLQLDGFEGDTEFIRNTSIIERKSKQLKKVEDEIQQLSKDDPEDRALIEEEMKLEFWARQMALRDSLKTDGGVYLLDEKTYTEPIKNYKIMGKKLMKKRLEDLQKERDERQRLKDKIKKMKLAEMGIDKELETQIDQIEKESKTKTNETLKELLSEEEFAQIQQQEEGQDFGDNQMDEDEELEEEYQNDGLPNLSRLRPHTHIPPPLEIIQEFLEIRKNELLKKSEEAADEFERKRRMKRIEFMARKKELQHKQMIENFKKKGLYDSVISDEDDSPIEIDPKVFHRFQSGEITEEEMFEISKNTPIEEIELEYDHEGRRKRDNEFLKHWKIGSIGIPPLLKKRIASTIKQMPTAELRSKAETLSENLRARTRLGKSIGSPSIVPSTDDKPVITYGKGEAMAYISHRMPGVYACTHRVFSEIKTRVPNFNPTTLLDYGSGPGTVLWSASTMWGEHLKRIRAVEPSPFMIEIAKKLMEGNTNHIKWTNYLNTEQHERRDGSLPESEMNELVTASYVLSELPDQLSRFTLVKDLWRNVKPSGMLVIIEPGTPIGFGIIKEIRQMLLDEGEEQLTIHKSTKAQVVAPCPHSGKCPLGFNSWCHFSQRVERPNFQKLAKGPGSTMPFEDEKYSYIVLSKVVKSNIPNQLEKQLNIYGEEELKEVKPWSRLIEAPLKRGGHVILDVCSPHGEINRVTVAKSHGREIYKEARKSFWSDAFILPEDTVDFREHRFNSTAEQEQEFLRLQELEKERLAKSLKKQHKKVSAIKQLEKEEEKERIEANRSVAAKKKEEEWMKELGGGDRKILEKLIKQGRFSTEETSSLFGDPALEKPIKSKPQAGLDFIEDANEIDKEEERKAIEEQEERERKEKQLGESRKSRKTRKALLLNELKSFKRQSMTPEQKEEFDKKREMFLQQKKEVKENDPTRIEYYLKDLDRNQDTVSEIESERRFKERLEKQTEQKEQFEKFKEEQLKKQKKLKQQQQQDDTFNNVD